MNAPYQNQPLTSWLPSAIAREQMTREFCEPFLYAEWDQVVMLHYAADPAVLQPLVPFALDLHDGQAWVSLVAFTLRGMQPRRGGWFTRTTFKPIATHEFLNVRTYVRHQGEPGIFFLAEWLPNRLAVALGPAIFGLPYRHGQLRYQNSISSPFISGEVETCGPRSTRVKLSYKAELQSDIDFEPAIAGTLDEFLLERYSAFTWYHGMIRRFRVWHPPWRQCRIDAEVCDQGLLSLTGRWQTETSLARAHLSPGLPHVWMGRPRFLGFQFQPRRHELN